MNVARTGSAAGLAAALEASLNPNAPKREIDRILGLPRVEPYAGDLTPTLALPSGSWDLFSVQSAALHTLHHVGGLFAPIKVGGGKTLVAHLAPVVLNRKIGLVFTTAPNVESMLKRHELETVPNFHTVPIRVWSYASLSRADASDLLTRLVERYGAHNLCVVCDEAHKLRNFASARTKRMRRFLTAYPEIPFVALTGTPAKDKLEDMAHLADWALGDRSPLPRPDRKRDLEVWGQALNVHAQTSYHDLEHLTRLVEWADQIENPSAWLWNVDTIKEAKRIACRAFNERLRTAAGVVTSKATDGYNGELRILARELELPDDVANAINTTLTTDTKPNGDPIQDDSDAWRIGQQLGAGFYYVWQWPAEPDLEWLDARRAWHRAIRHELKRHAAEHYDSPLLVRNRIARECEEGELAVGSGRSIHDRWLEWLPHRDKTFHGKPKPPTASVWVSGFLLADAIEWLQSQPEPAILWYWSRAIGDALASAGVPVYGAGHLRGIPEFPESLGVWCAASIRSYGTGKNLQWARRCLVLECPSSGEILEQLIGRTHRNKQPSPWVEWTFYQHTDGARASLKKARAEAVFLEDSTGYPYKLTLANYEGFDR